MTYSSWSKEHIQKRSALLISLVEKGFSNDDIVKHFSWANMVRSHPEYCGLYAENKKCHNLQELNCLFCACPHFVFNDNGLYIEGLKTVYSRCGIDSRFGTEFEYDIAIHQDCTLCLIPHTKQFAYKYLNNLLEKLETKERN